MTMATMADVFTTEDSLAAAVCRAAEVRSTAPAIIDAGSSLTWSEVRDRAAAMAHGLRELGHAPGARIGVLAGVGSGNLELSAAMSWAGLVAVPVNVRLAAREMVKMLRIADVAALLFEPDYAASAKAIAEELGVQAVGTGSLPVSGAMLDRFVWDADTLALILFTGGTTGVPKGVMHTAGALVIQGRNVCNCLAYDRNTVALHSQPAFHVAGMNQLFALTLAAATIVFRPDAGPSAVYQEIARNGVNAIGAVPTTLALLLAAPERDDASLARLRSVVYGAAPISEQLLRDVLAAMPNARLCQFYGLTETGPVTALLPEHHRLDDPSRLRSAGLPRSHVEIRVCDASGDAVATGTVGEVMVRGYGLTLGYWRDEARTVELFDDGWLHTGDAGVLDAAGFLTIADRYKDMIVTGGENVFSGEVENVVASFPGVHACAVFGVPDDFWGEAVTVAVVEKPGETVNPPDLIAFCREQIAGYKCPKRVIVRREPLPLSGLGKVLKHVLRAEAVAEQAAAA